MTVSPSVFGVKINHYRRKRLFERDAMLKIHILREKPIFLLLLLILAY
jgi:hypothetical protein